MPVDVPITGKVYAPPRDLSRRFVGIYALLLEANIQSGGTITRWWNSIEGNRLRGGDADSQHQIGWAIDVVPVTAARAAAFRARGLTVIDEGDHLHVQVSPAGFANATVRALRR